MLTKSAKAKGRNLQNWVAAKISKITRIPWGKDKDIASRIMGQSGTDIILRGKAKKLFPFAVEAKRQEVFSIPAWIKQAESNVEEGTNWLLVCRRSHEEAIVVLLAEQFFDIYGELINFREWREHQ